MLRFKSQTAFVFLLLALISCTIIKDSDVTSLDQLNNLKLSSIEIVQSLNNSGASSSNATVEDSLFKTPVDTTIDVNLKISGLVVKQTSIAWPVFTKTKMIFRSKIFSTGIVIKNYFYQNGKPRSSKVYQNGQLKEWYSFYYDNSYKPTNLISRIYLSVPAADTIVTRDSLIYGTSGIESGHVTSILRKIRGTASPVTIHFPYTNTYGGNINLGNSNSGGSNTTYGSYQYNYGNCLCPNNSNNSCFGCDAQLSTGQGTSPTSHYLIEGQQLSNLLSQLEITDVKVNINGSCGQSGATTNYDTYYYHPLMMLRGLFTNGDILLNIYAIDWLQPGSTTSINVGNNETVTFNFNYAH